MTRAIPSVLVAACGDELLAVSSEACAVTWGKSINEIVEECVSWVRDAARFMGECESEKF